MLAVKSHLVAKINPGEPNGQNLFCSSPLFPALLLQLNDLLLSMPVLHEIINSQRQQDLRKNKNDDERRTPVLVDFDLIGTGFHPDVVPRGFPPVTFLLMNCTPDRRRLPKTGFNSLPAARRRRDLMIDRKKFQLIFEVRQGILQ